MGRDSGGARLHARDVRVQGSSQGPKEARSRRVRFEHPDDLVSAGDGGAAPRALRGVERRASGVRPSAAAADLRGRRHDAGEAAHVDPVEESDREGFLSGVSTRQARGGSGGLADGQPSGTKERGKMTGAKSTTNVAADLRTRIESVLPALRALSDADVSQSR